MLDDVTDRVLNIIAESQKIPREQVKPDSSFEELNLDSMDGMNILFGLENEFDITIPDSEAKQIRSVRDMIDGVKRMLDSKPPEIAPASN